MSHNKSRAVLSGIDQLVDSGVTLDLQVMSGTIGPDVIDVRKLYAQTGKFTYDPGFTSTASCESAITYIDGEEGILMHRGYSIESLTEHGSYLETCYLLLFGELPDKSEMLKFEHDITMHTMLHEQLYNFFKGFRRDAHPMAIMCGVVGALSAFYHDSTDINDARQRKVACYRMIAKMPTIAAMAYKYHVGQPFIYPRNDLRYADNFLRMCFGVPSENWVSRPALAQAMDKIFTLRKSVV